MAGAVGGPPPIVFLWDVSGGAAGPPPFLFLWDASDIAIVPPLVSSGGIPLFPARDWEHAGYDVGLDPDELALLVAMGVLD